VNVVLDPAADEDGDGLTNGTEISRGTNPYQKDSDGDGVNDPVEIADGTNPNDANSYNNLNKGLVAYYPFNGNANDASGNGRNGAPINAVLAPDASGVLNRAYEFNGTSSLITVPHDEALSLSGVSNFTVSTMVRLEKSGVYLFGKDNGAGAQSKWIFAYATPPSTTNQGLFFHVQNTANSGAWMARATNAIANTNWQHLVYTREGNLHRTFINGRMVATETNSTAMPAGITAPFTIGSAENGGWVKGAMDQVRIYNRTLSFSEVGQLYQAEAGNLGTLGITFPFWDGFETGSLSSSWDKSFTRGNGFCTVNGTKSALGV
jgi:hypothetical protein